MTQGLTRIIRLFNRETCGCSVSEPQYLNPCILKRCHIVIQTDIRRLRDRRPQVLMGILTKTN